MFKFIYRVLFQSAYRHNAPPPKAPVEDDVRPRRPPRPRAPAAKSETTSRRVPPEGYDALSRETSAECPAEDGTPITVSRDEANNHEASRPVFDEKTAERVAEPRILEGPAYVTDGDTITIQKTQVRLFGIDAPELDHPYGKKAKWAMVRLCKGQRIRAEVTAEDDYGRTVAKCFLPDGRDLSALMVEQGLAIDWPKYSEGRYSHLEKPGVRKKLWLADARQKGRSHVWHAFEARNKSPDSSQD